MDEGILLFGKDYVVNEKITVRHPKLRDIFDRGERNYMTTVSLFSSTPADYKSQLFDMGIDYESISDFDLFTMMCSGLHKEDTEVLFGDIDFSKFVPAFHKEANQDVIVDIENEIIIDKILYQKISQFICDLHGFKKNMERAGNKYTKKIMIELHKEECKRNESKEYHSMYCPLVSALVNTAGFKYDYTTVLDLPLFTFMDAVKRVNKIKTYEGFISGAYSGNIDISKIKDKDKILNWMGDD